MMNFEKELERIFDDPLLADVKPPRKRVSSSDRLVAGFQQIQDFYEANGRLPEDNPTESKLFHMWKGLLSKPQNIERCNWVFYRNKFKLLKSHGSSMDANFLKRNR